MAITKLEPGKLYWCCYCYGAWPKTNVIGCVAKASAHCAGKAHQCLYCKEKRLPAIVWRARGDDGTWADICHVYPESTRELTDNEVLEFLL